MRLATINDLTYTIRGAIFNVYNKLGPGLLESIYESALIYELEKCDLYVESQKEISVYYDGVRLPVSYRIDLLVNKKVVIEIKSVEEVSKVCYKQLRTYLRLTDCSLGILVNFNTLDISKSITRVLNNYNEKDLTVLD